MGFKDCEDFAVSTPHWQVQNVDDAARERVSSRVCCDSATNGGAMAFVMSTESLRKHCRKLNLYSSRLDLNDILHLQCKGITKIQGLEEFTGLTTLYLESNAISDIEGLEPVLKLSSLYLAKNFLSSTVGLGMLANLQVLDLADNNLSKLESLEALTQLRTLNVSGNKLSDLDALRELTKLPELMSLDLSNNRIGRKREGVTKAEVHFAPRRASSVHGPTPQGVAAWR